MHKRSVTVAVDFESGSFDKEQVISDAIYKINGVAQWKIEEIREDEYTVQIWLANGLGHVNAKNAVTRVLEKAEEIESFTVSS